jgi:serine/threonine protein kinase
VYRARHALLRRPAAIKVLQAELTSERDLARFEREAQLTSQLTHPNTVSIFDYGRTPRGGLYFVMEYLDGLNLHELVKRHGPLPASRAMHILMQVCGALEEAHRLGLVHRDIKPDNIILTSRVDEPDVVKVVDFGLVRSSKEETKVTLGRSIVGTPGYMAPETLTGGEVDARSDLYALGCVAHYLLTGRSVFRGRSFIDTARRHMAEAPPPPSRHAPAVPEGLDAIVLRCLAKAPSDRFATAADLRAALVVCARAHPFDAEEARGWWRKHAAMRSAAAEPDADAVGVAAPPSEPKSLAIDLKRRLEFAKTRGDRERPPR